MRTYRTGSSGTILCPNCNSRMSRVVKTTSRELKWKGKVKEVVVRIRACCHCGEQYRTLELEEREIEQPKKPTDPPPPDNQPTEQPPTPKDKDYNPYL